MEPTDPRQATWHAFVQLWQEFQGRTDEERAVVVVEGERDRTALQRLGIRGAVALVHNGHSLGAVAQSLAELRRPVIVLTDWDTEGGHLARRLREFFEASGVDFDLEFRRKLARLLKGELVHVEGLAGWARRSAEREGAPLDHFLPADR